MQLYLVRHGIALDVGQEGVTRDGDRPLSKEGIRKTQEVGRGLAALGVHPDRIVSSPLVRAEQTARILAAELALPGDPEPCDLLQPGESPADFTAWLAKQKVDSLLAVGHLPDVAELTSHLIAGTPNANVLFKKAAACCIHFEESPARGTGCLEWLMQPGQIRHLRA